MAGSAGSADERLWWLIAWGLGLVGAVIAYVAGPGDEGTKFWARNSIGFSVLMFAGYVTATVLGGVPLVGSLLWLGVTIGGFIVWVVGLVKIMEGVLWSPPIAGRIAELLGL